MKIVIKLYEDSEGERLYEVSEAYDFLAAEAELARMGRHITKDILEGKFHQCGRCGNLVEPVAVSVGAGDELAEGEMGHSDECPVRNL